MMKSEFEKLIDCAVSNEEYKIIELVYMYHPAIDEVKGKKQIAVLYNTCGMPLISSMVSEAQKAKENSEAAIKAYRACITLLSQMSAQVKKTALYDGDVCRVEEALGHIAACADIIRVI